MLIDNKTSDDAAVYKISDTEAIIQTVDFFTPMVDDAYDFGQIAAANALSDIYAMGAQPLFALNIVAFPDNRLPEETLQQILKGAADKANEAGISILGGHTIEDNEPKFGMTVTAVSHPDKIVSNAGAKPGDIIFLTKPIGTGIISTAIKRGIVENETENEAINTMKELNRKAAELIQKFSVNACTDVTGFGLLGHLSELAEASCVSAKIFLDEIPLIKGCNELALADCIPGGTKNNYEYTINKVEYDANISVLDKMILNDAQTSGGLLICLPAKFKNDFIGAAEQMNLSALKENWRNN
ncbi:MAG: selenide, water dikinase SelD [Chloroflexia bacterium]|nr:selenide, water dikinase SelD [Chloroflexia bacterium]